ncbi:MAG: nucleotide sugar dehydrogenase [Sphingobacteriales bacterium]|nr:MAG: nucleotide sugar dehydrogenase [Sphingobacteriales bacterium]
MTFGVSNKVAVVGLGYVGLPLAVAFAKHYQVIGYDINKNRVEELTAFNDETLEIEHDQLKEIMIAEDGEQQRGLMFTDELAQIAGCTVFIITVPTPIDQFKQPNLEPLKAASKQIGSVLKKGDIVIYESTVYPGCTEEDCVPLLETHSGLKFNTDFFAGYSPERINPGDKSRKVEEIVKITSGSTAEVAAFIDALYAKVIVAGTYLAPNIKVAEAAKVIENAQRDINIAFVNEIAKICNKLEISTQEVLKAAGTKWNFQPYTPGLAGGHCIGVDPYYLALKAKEEGYYPGLILAARRLNESMAEHIAAEIIKKMIKKGSLVKGADLLMLGITFKENCTDSRNSKIVEVIQYLTEYGINVSIFDPWANPEKVKEEFGLTLLTQLPEEKFDAIVVGVAHQVFLELNYQSLKKENAIIYDVKGLLPFEVDGQL